MQTFSELIDKIGPAQLGRIIGVTTEHAAAMKRRNSIPASYWPALVNECAGREGLEAVNLELLADLAKHRRNGAASSQLSSEHAA